jgi:hypothetical protein
MDVLIARAVAHSIDRVMVTAPLNYGYAWHHATLPMTGSVGRGLAWHVCGLRAHDVHSYAPASYIIDSIDSEAAGERDQPPSKQFRGQCSTPHLS